MNKRQKQAMDSLVRVRSFLDAYPATGRLTYASAREMLDDVVQRLRAYAGARITGRELSRAELRRQADQIALLFEAVFVANGLPAEFLAQFASARNALERLAGGRATLVSTHVAARAGLQVQLRRGRRAVERLDAIVRASFRGNVVAITTWRVARRVHQVPGGTGGTGVESEALQAA